MDDYYVITTDTWRLIREFTKHGRPFYATIILLQKVVFATFPTLEQAAIFLHCIQAGIHTLTAVLIGLFLVRSTKRHLAVLAVTPFLFWPINEVAFWTATLGYALAGLFSVAGVYLICSKTTNRWRWLGTLLIVLATLTTQTACLVGFMMYAIAFLIGWSQGHRVAEYKRSLLWIITAYVAGGTGSSLLAFFFSYRVDDVTYFAWKNAVQIFSGSMNQILFAHRLPSWIRHMHILVLFLGPMYAIISAILTQKKATNAVIRSAGIVMCMGALLVIPLIPLYAISQIWLAARLLYAVPLALTAALSLLLIPVSHRALSAGVFLALTLTLGTGYIPISSISASEHIQTFEGDRRRLRMLEQIAQQNHITTVTLANLPERSVHYNPYGYRYHTGSSKSSAFTWWWASDPFIDIFSMSLRTVRNAAVTQKCVEYCNAASFDAKDTEDSRRMTILAPAEELLLCYCP